MLFYIFLLVLILIGIVFPKKQNVFVFLLIILCIFVFFRDKTVGTDVEYYSINFNKINNSRSTWNWYIPFETGFNYLILYFKKIISSNPLDCWGTIGVFYTISCCYFFKKYTKNSTLSITLFVLLGTYFLCYNIMRQCFSTAILLALFTFIDIKSPSKIEKLLLILGILSCGFLFHSTSFAFLTLFPFYIPKIQHLFCRKFMIILLTISFVCFATQIIIPILSYILEHIFVEGKLINYAIRNMQSGENSGFSLVKISMITAFQIYTIYISKNLKNIFLYMSTIGLLFLNIFVPLVVEFARVYELFVVFQIVYFSQLWFSIEKNTNKSYLYRTSLIIYSLFIYSNIILKNYGEIVPYTFRF